MYWVTSAICSQRHLSPRHHQPLRFNPTPEPRTLILTSFTYPLPLASPHIALLPTDSPGALIRSIHQAAGAWKKSAAVSHLHQAATPIPHTSTTAQRAQGKFIKRAPREKPVHAAGTRRVDDILLLPAARALCMRERGRRWCSGAPAPTAPLIERRGRTKPGGGDFRIRGVCIGETKAPRAGV